LSFITSLGIYGLLSNNYQNSLNNYNKEQYIINNINNQKNILIEDLLKYEREKQDNSLSIHKLIESISDNKIEYIDKESNQKVTTISTSNRVVLEKQINNLELKNTKIQNNIDSINNLIHNYSNKLYDININENNDKLNILMHFSNTVKLSINKIINWFIILIVLVFDPLAIAFLSIISQISNFSKGGFLSTNSKTIKWNKNKQKKAKITFDPQSNKHTIETE
jgi:hypothetical protein